MEILYLLITEKFLFWPLRKWEIRSLFELKKLMERWYLLITKSSSFELFGDGKYGLFLSQEVDGKMIFTDYWEVLVLTFRKWEIRSFLSQKLMERQYLLITERSSFELFSDGKYGLFWVKKLIERWYLLVTEKFLFLTFQLWKTRSFFQSKSWWKDDIYLVFLRFPWYSRTWEIWFFVQWVLTR